MKPHDRIDDELRELAIAHVLGNRECVDPERLEAWRTHLPDCVTCSVEHATLLRTAEAMADAVAPIEPPARAWTAIEAGMEAASQSSAAAGTESPPAQAWKHWSDSAGDVIVDDAIGTGWEETGHPGVAVRRLHLDRAADRVTMLVRMAAGSRYPPHRHRGPEECLVLEGDLDVGEHRLRAGGYQRLGENSTHPWQSTESGCLLLIISSLSDEMLEGDAPA